MPHHFHRDCAGASRERLAASLQTSPCLPPLRTSTRALVVPLTFWRKGYLQKVADLLAGPERPRSVWFLRCVRAFPRRQV